MSKKSRWTEALEEAPVDDQKDEIKDSIKSLANRFKNEGDGHDVVAKRMRESGGDDYAEDHEIEAETARIRSNKLDFIKEV